MDDLRELFEHIPVLIALLAWAASIVFRFTRRRSREAGGSAASPEPSRQAAPRWSGTSAGSTAGAPPKGYRPIEPR